MINLFKKFTPSFQNIVRKFAVDVWYGRESEKEFLKKIREFRQRFEKEIISFYRAKGLKVDFKEIQNLSLQWESEQILISQKIKKNIKSKERKALAEKKEEIQKEQKELYESAKAKRRKDFTPVVESLTAGKMNSEYLKKSKQIGDESAFDFISKINNKILIDNSSKGVFRWITQGDNHVRKTHRKLDKKIFAWNNLPKIDGEEVEPGSQWGCRCYAEITTGKPLKNYEVKS